MFRMRVSSYNVFTQVLRREAALLVRIQVHGKVRRRKNVRKMQFLGMFDVLDFERIWVQELLGLVVGCLTLVSRKVLFFYDIRNAFLRWSGMRRF